MCDPLRFPHSPIKALLVLVIVAILLTADGMVRSTATASSPDSENCEDQVPSLRETYGIDSMGNGLSKSQIDVRHHYSGQLTYPPIPPVLRNTTATVALQGDGKILVAGTAGYDLALIRYNIDGSLDSTFGTGGIVTARIGTPLPQPLDDIPTLHLYFDLVSSLILQADGRIIIGGSTAEANPANPLYPDRRFFVARFTHNGQLDTSFGSHGKITPRFGLGGIILASLPESEMLVAIGSLIKLSLVRLQVTGLVDTDFGDNGAIEFTPQSLPVVDSFLERILPYRKPSIALFRTIESWQPEIALLRYASSGTTASMVLLGMQSSDQFGNGRGTIAVGQDHLSLQTATPTKDRQVVVGGFASRPDLLGEDAALARYNQNGAVDLKFGTTGIASVSYDKLIAKNKQEGLSHDWPYFCRGFCQVIEQEDGKIVAAASPMGHNFALVRFLADGSRDHNFGTEGKVLTSIGSQGDVVGALALQPDGKIVLAGTCGNALHTNVALIRYNTNGSLDSTFGKGGKVTTRVGPKVYDRSLGRAIAPLLSFMTGK